MHCIIPESVSIINCSNTGMMIHFDGEAKPTDGIVGEYSQPWATLKNNCSIGGSDGGIIRYIACIWLNNINIF